MGLELIEVAIQVNGSMTPQAARILSRHAEELTKEIVQKIGDRAKGGIILAKDVEEVLLEARSRQP